MLSATNLSWHHHNRGTSSRQIERRTKKCVLEDFCRRKALREGVLVSVQAGQRRLLRSGDSVMCRAPGSGRGGGAEEEKSLCDRTPVRWESRERRGFRCAASKYGKLGSSAVGVEASIPAEARRWDGCRGERSSVRSLRGTRRRGAGAKRLVRAASAKSPSLPTFTPRLPGRELACSPGQAACGRAAPRRAVPWVAAAAAPAPDVGVSGRTEGGAAPGGPRCGFISGAGRDARRRQGAAKQQEAARSLAGPTAAQPGPGRRW